MSKNEQLDFNSYVFKKYYQPKEKDIEKIAIKEKDKKNIDKTFDKKSKQLPSVIVTTIKEEIQKCKEDINNNDKEIIHQEVLNQVNDEIFNDLMNQKKTKQEEYGIMLDEHNMEIQKQKDDENAKNYKPLIENTLNHPNNNSILGKSKEGYEYIDDYQIAKQEKEREKLKRIQYSKILQEQIEEQKQFKIQQAEQKQFSNKNKNNPSYTFDIPQHPQPHLRHHDQNEYDYSLVQSQQPIPPCDIEALIIDNDNINTILPHRSIACKTPQETQQVISTYANILSNFCDKRLEKYQNTQMIFKPYEKMLNDLVDIKINQLNPSSHYQDQERLHDIEVNDIKLNQELEQYNLQQDQLKDKTGISAKLKPINKEKKQKIANTLPRKIVPSSNSNINKKTVIGVRAQAKNQSLAKRNSGIALAQVSTGRLLKTAEPSIRKNNRNNASVSNKKQVI